MIFRLENLSSEPPCVGKARHSENKSCILLNGSKRGSEPHSFLSLINFNAFPGTAIAVTKMILCAQILRLASPSAGKPELSSDTHQRPPAIPSGPECTQLPGTCCPHPPPDPVLGTYQGDPGRMKGALSICPSAPLTLLSTSERAELSPLAPTDGCPLATAGSF